jgi:hypothetical protein
MNYQRKTEDEYIIQGFTPYGWEDLTAEATRKAALVNLKAYREADTTTIHRLIKRRIKKAYTQTTNQ